MPDTVLDPTRLRAIIFDLDGTLYRQGSLRRAMALRLVRAHIARPVTGYRTLRVLGAYRAAQERLRESAAFDPRVDLAEAQLQYACAQTGADREFVATNVERWMEHEPLELLPSRVRPGVSEFLQACQARQLRLAVLSDYQPEAKLRALGIDGYFDLTLAAQSPDIGVFKPHPRGLLVAAQRLQVTPNECLYIGDRPEVDATAAAAAGMASCIVTDAAGFPQLNRRLFGAADTRSSSTSPRPSLNGA